MTMWMRLTTFLALTVAAALVIVATSRDSAAVTTFSPGGVICFENFDANDYNANGAVRDAQECDGDASPGAGADKYPAYLKSFFDVDHDPGPDGIFDTSVDTNGSPASSDDVNGSLPPLQPISRQFGATFIYGQWVVLNFLTFAPGSTVRGPDR